MAVPLLIRHAHHCYIGKRILGWMPDVHVSEEGQTQAERLAEVRAGEWTGQDFADLERDPRWQTYNLFRSGVRPAGGELAAEVQARLVAEMERLRVERPDAVMAVFSHADPIRAAVAYNAGIPLDLLLRIHIEPASLTTIEVNDWGPLLRGVNTPLPDGTPGAT